MQWFKRHSYLKILVLSLLFIALCYGGGRLYFHLTGGFTTGNIVFTEIKDTRWEIRPLEEQEEALVNSILTQEFTYLGKGCQSYVFLSQDGHYVIKFFKYQRFKVSPLLEAFSFLPILKEYYQEKMEKKKKKREGLYHSWKIAFENLQPETGLLFVHLNNSNHLKRALTIYDKLGFQHQVDLDTTEFLIQKKAKMLCSYIDELMDHNREDQAKAFLKKIIALILSEYQRGYADNDHALMQNTGVLEGNPIHIDVGQFVQEERATDPEFYKQELFNKTYKFRSWLEKQHPTLKIFLEEQLIQTIGDPFFAMKPHFKLHGE